MSSISGNYSLNSIYQSLLSRATTSSSGNSTKYVQENEAGLSALVDSGKITEEQKQEVINTLQYSFGYSYSPLLMKEPESPISVTLSELVNSGTITSDQSDQIQSALEENLASIKEIGRKPSPNDISEVLSELVNSGIISQQESESILAAIEEDSNKMPPPPPMPPMPPEIMNSFQNLVENETITEDQLEAIIAALQESRGDFESTLQTLFEEGTLSETQFESVMDTIEELEISMPSPPPIPPEIINSLNSLVESGTLTEDQEEAVITALSSSENETLGTLLEQGILSDEEYDDLIDSLRNAIKFDEAFNMYNSMMENSLNLLVQSGSITDAQEELILGSLKRNDFLV